MNFEKMKTAIPFVLFGCLILLLLFGLHPRRHTGLLATASLHAGDKSPDTDLPAMDGGGGRFRTYEWRGRPYILNFFATWCPDCRAEHEELMTLADPKIPIIGVAFKDRRDKIINYLDHAGNPYIFVGQDDDGATQGPWKLAGIPETFIIDARGVVRWHYAGILTDDIITQQLMPAWEMTRSLKY